MTFLLEGYKNLVKKLKEFYEENDSKSKFEDSNEFLVNHKSTKMAYSPLMSSYLSSSSESYPDVNNVETTPQSCLEYQSTSYSSPLSGSYSDINNVVSTPQRYVDYQPISCSTPSSGSYSDSNNVETTSQSYLDYQPTSYSLPSSGSYLYVNYQLSNYSSPSSGSYSDINNVVTPSQNYLDYQPKSYLLPSPGSYSDVTYQSTSYSSPSSGSYSDVNYQSTSYSLQSFESYSDVNYQSTRYSSPSSGSYSDLHNDVTTPQHYLDYQPLETSYSPPPTKICAAVNNVNVVTGSQQNFNSQPKIPSYVPQSSGPCIDINDTDLVTMPKQNSNYQSKMPSLPYKKIVKVKQVKKKQLKHIEYMPSCSVKRLEKKNTLPIRKQIPNCIRKNPGLKKYYDNRYKLFSKYDNGIMLDEESWFSVTPEKIAKHIAKRCQSDIIVDAFCGAGGNSIAFALTCERVYAIDIDPNKIAMAKHNAEIYGVADKIEFIVGDFFCLADSLFADVVFLSPPWGGPSYNQNIYFNFEDILFPRGGTELLEIASKISYNVAFYLPKNVDTIQIDTAADLLESEVDIESNFDGKRLVAVTAYFGDL